MRLPGGGIDIFYVDESTDARILVASAVAIPFMRLVEGTWTITWEDHLANVREWRRRLSQAHSIPVRKELKGSKLASGRGRYLLGRHQLQLRAAAAAYFDALRDTGWLQPLSIITVIGTSTSQLYGHTRLEAVVNALLQRMRTACDKSHRVGMVFFDEGHGEYRKLYRKARVYLPTGSVHGDWGNGKATKNIPLDNFVKDANIKQSQHSYFIQLADMIAYAALLKRRGELGALTAWQKVFGLEKLYDAIPHGVLNVRANASDPEGIVRLS